MWFFFCFCFFLTEAGSRRKAGVMAPAFRLLPIVLVKKKTLNT